MRYSSAAHTQFTTDFTSCGSQNIATRFCRIQCVNGSVKLSCKLAQKWGSISCKLCWAKTMCICSCRYRQSWPCPTSCSASKAVGRDGSSWGSLRCGSVTGEDAFGPEVISQPPPEMSLTISSRSIWSYIPLNEATGVSRYWFTCDAYLVKPNEFLRTFLRQLRRTEGAKVCLNHAAKVSHNLVNSLVRN